MTLLTVLIKQRFCNLHLPKAPKKKKALSLFEEDFDEFVHEGEAKPIEEEVKEEVVEDTPDFALDLNVDDPP